MLLKHTKRIYKYLRKKEEQVNNKSILTNKPDPQDFKRHKSCTKLNVIQEITNYSNTIIVSFRYNLT